jgi:hypothetical protein
MGDRFSAKRAFLPILIVIGLAGLQPAGRAQAQDRTSGPAGRTGQAALADDRSEDPNLRRLAAALSRYRSSGDDINAARIFAQMFRLEPLGDPAAALKASSAGPYGIPASAAAVKELFAADGTSPVFFSTEDERNPAADLWISPEGPVLVSAAEQWTGGQAGPIGLRMSADGGRSWTGATTLGDARPWTRPVLRQVSAGTMGLAFVREWSARDGDISFVRLTGDLAPEGEYALACGPADETNPSLASDYRAFPSPYLYAVYAERDGEGRAVKFRLSPDLGASWSRAVSIAAFAGPSDSALETALAYDPDRNILHAAFTCPQGSSTGIGVSTSRDFGASWSRPLFVTPPDGLADRSPRIAAAQGRVVIVYEHATPGGGFDIGLASSSTAGRSFSTGGRLASTAAGDRFPDVRTGPGPAPTAFFASYVEAGTRLVVLRRDVAGAEAWTTEMTLTAGRAVPSGPVALVPLPSSDPGGAAGVLWTDNNPDADVLFGSIHILADAILVTPANRDVPYTAGTTTFAVDKSGEGSVSWTATVIAGSDWLSIRSGASGTDAGTITVDFDGNPTVLSRVGSIRVSATDGSVPDVTVTVTQAGAPGLEVSPAEGFTSTGPEGGPFVPASKEYTLSNPGSAPVSWTAAEGRNWLQLSRTSGTLEPGTSDIVTVFFTASADGLSQGDYTATVTFTNRTNDIGNTTRGVLLTVTGPAGSLAVTPAGGLASSGYVGGPFTPSSQVYTLRNPGSTSPQPPERSPPGPPGRSPSRSMPPPIRSAPASIKTRSRSRTRPTARAPRRAP